MTDSYRQYHDNVSFAHCIGRIKQENYTGKIAVHLNMSQFQNVKLRNYMHLIHESVQKHVYEYYPESSLFILANNDIIWIAPFTDTTYLDKIFSKIEYLIVNMSLSHIKKEKQYISYIDYLNIFFLDQDLQGFVTFSGSLLKNMYDREQRIEKLKTKNQEMPLQFKIERPPITPERFYDVYNIIRSLNVEELIRKKNVFALSPDQKILPLFDEISINIGELNKKIFPEIDLQKNKNFLKEFEYITSKMLLRFMIKTFTPKKESISLNLSPEIVLSDLFKEIDQKMRPREKAQTIIEISIDSIFTDFDLFLVAKEFLKHNSYKIAIDGLNFHCLDTMNLSNLHVDFLKFRASDDLSTEVLDKEKGIAIQEKLKNIHHSAKKILYNCTTDQSLKTAQECGFNIMQK